MFEVLRDLKDKRQQNRILRVMLCALYDIAGVMWCRKSTLFMYATDIFVVFCLPYLAQFKFGCTTDLMGLLSLFLSVGASVLEEGYITISVLSPMQGPTNRFCGHAHTASRTTSMARG